MKKAYDSLGRRRQDIRTPSTKIVRQLDRDVNTLAFIHRHGDMLPTPFLTEFNVKEGYVDVSYSSTRLTSMHHDFNWLSRPDQDDEDGDAIDYNRDNTVNKFGRTLVHKINGNGLSVLEDEDLYSSYHPFSKGHYKHQLASYCTTASFDLNARDTDNVKYIPQHVLLKEAKKELRIPLKCSKKDLIPDAFFGLEIDGKRILFLLELDRGTEPSKSSSTRKDFTQIIQNYTELIGGKKYKEFFGVDCGAILLFVTASQAKEDRFIELIGHNCKYMWTHHVKGFGKRFKTPVVLDMLGVDWQRYGYPAFRLK